MRSKVIWDTATNSYVLEVKGGPLSIIGETAFNVLGFAASQCQISNLVFSSESRKVSQASTDAALPPEELLLGGIISQYHKAFDEARRGKRSAKPPALIEAGIKQAFEVYDSQLDRARAASKKGYQILFPKPEAKNPNSITSRKR